MASSPADSPITSLSFTSWNDDKQTTIVLLHGGFTCRLEFALVLPHLSDFHVLLPDLPLHSASRHIKPGTTDKSAWYVAQLIRSHAHGGKAHVVGVSMGGYIGQCLALDQPDLVLSLFVAFVSVISVSRKMSAASCESNRCVRPNPSLVYGSRLGPQAPFPPADARNPRRKAATSKMRSE